MYARALRVIVVQTHGRSNTHTHTVSAHKMYKMYKQWTGFDRVVLLRTPLMWCVVAAFRVPERLLFRDAMREKSFKIILALNKTNERNVVIVVWSCGQARPGAFSPPWKTDVTKSTSSTSAQPTINRTTTNTNAYMRRIRAHIKYIMCNMWTRFVRLSTIGYTTERTAPAVWMYTVFNNNTNNNVEKYLSRFSKQIRLESPNLRLALVACRTRARASPSSSTFISSYH